MNIYYMKNVKKDQCIFPNGHGKLCNIGFALFEEGVFVLGFLSCPCLGGVFLTILQTIK